MHSTYIYNVPTVCQGLFFRLKFIVESRTMACPWRVCFLICGHECACAHTHVYTHTHTHTHTFFLSSIGCLSLNPSSATTILHFLHYKSWTKIMSYGIPEGIKGNTIRTPRARPCRAVFLILQLHGSHLEILLNCRF